MNAELFKQKREAAVAQAEALLKQVKETDVDAILAEIAKHEAAIADLNAQLASLAVVLGIEADKPKGKGKVKASAGGTRTRMSDEEKKSKVVAALKEAGGKGLTVQEISTKTGIAGQTAYLFLKSPAIKADLETVKDGRIVIYSLKATAAAPIATGKGPNKAKK